MVAAGVTVNGLEAKSLSDEKERRVQLQID
jgi:hypothetical protein